MALTSIGAQKTPGRPIEITYDADTSLPVDTQEIVLIGHRASGASSGTVEDYAVTIINNSGDLTAASGEVAAKFGDGSEIAKMVLAAVKANSGASSSPVLKAIPLPASETGFGPSDEALTSVKKVKAEFIVSPYDGTDTTLRGKLKDTALAMSGAQRVENNQFGTIGVVFNRSVTDPSTLPAPDSLNLLCVYMRDTGTGLNAPAYSLGEMAAAVVAKGAANGVPFMPVDNVTVVGIDAPKKASDVLTVGAGLESETALQKGWTPLKVKANGEVAIVRLVTSRITVDGVVAAGAYYDVADYQVLYYWRKTLFTRLNQPDLKQVKASQDTAKLIKSEVIRLAQAFQDQGMFQAVSELAKQFKVERNAQDRHRIDVKTPVNVVPGLHVVAVNIVATTQYDTITV